ncbi:MAG: carbohydrate ABC transporter substrate-binding protein [Pseudomonadales bacterium]|nr:carbohydrate ABC transporter substrate-binding protein [Pseudomonadales bacterium]
MPLSLARLLQRAFCGLLVTGFYSTPLLAQEAVPKEQLAQAQGWIAKEFQPSTLTAAEQLAEMTWFIHAAAPYRGMQIRVVSEQIPTHEYESKVLARAFADITGIEVVHEITGEDDVVKKLQAQMQTGLPIYDAYVNDSDFIGTHFRKGKTLVLSDYMLSEGREVTLPSLDLADFMALRFTSGPDGKLYQLPDQQFANLYWYRHDWFSRPELKQAFAQRYGYPLGVPQNWRAYEDIAEFFTVHVRELDGQRVWGHMDYGRMDPSLGWRFSDAWLGLAGVGDPGLPNGLPVDDWGIRVDGCHPVGASVSRGGALDSPAAIYAMSKYKSWLDRFAPPQARDLTFTTSTEWVPKGQIAQQIFWYTAFVPNLLQAGNTLYNPDGSARWRVAPSPVGAYWRPGMKSGYQDVGAWTLLDSTAADRQAAAWLYAQFTVAKSVSLRKALVGLTPVRLSDVQSQAMTDAAPRLGGLVEFYRSRARDVWTPTGTNVPDYAALAALWWQQLGPMVDGRQTVSSSVHNLASQMDLELARIAEQGELQRCQPRLAPPRDAAYWLAQPGSPAPQGDEQPAGQTLAYPEAIRKWQ